MVLQQFEIENAAFSLIPRLITAKQVSQALSNSFYQKYLLLLSVMTLFLINTIIRIA